MFTFNIAKLRAIDIEICRFILFHNFSALFTLKWGRHSIYSSSVSVCQSSVIFHTIHTYIFSLVYLYLCQYIFIYNSLCHVTFFPLHNMSHSCETTWITNEDVVHRGCGGSNVTTSRFGQDHNYPNRCLHTSTSLRRRRPTKWCAEGRGAY